MNNRIQVLIADDQPRARQSLKALLSTLPQIDQVREAVNGYEGIHLIEEHRPDLVLFDVRMPELDGLEATRLVKARWPQIKIIVLSLYGDYASDALAAGADALQQRRRSASIAGNAGDLGFRTRGSAIPNGERT